MITVSRLTYFSRAFLSIEEYKSQLGFASDEQLNIFFAEWTIDSLIGLATFPWEKEIFSVLGTFMNIAFALLTGMIENILKTKDSFMYINAHIIYSYMCMHAYGFYVGIIGYVHIYIYIYIHNWRVAVFMCDILVSHASSCMYAFITGGTVVRPDSFGHLGKTDNLVHEIGHNLGLWHVHHGITEIESCDDPCMEVEPSLELGDLCLDTTPTPINQQCRDPLPEELRAGTCGMTEFMNTPFNNYMSYAGKLKYSSVNKRFPWMWTIYTCSHHYPTYPEIFNK